MVAWKARRLNFGLGGNAFGAMSAEENRTLRVVNPEVTARKRFRRYMASHFATAEGPGSMLSFVSGNAIQCDKENHGWREGPPLTVPAKVSICQTGLHPPAKSISNEKRILLCVGGREPLTQEIGRFKTANRIMAWRVAGYTADTKYGLYHLIANPAAQFTYFGIAVRGAGGRK